MNLNPLKTTKQRIKISFQIHPGRLQPMGQGLQGAGEIPRNGRCTSCEFRNSSKKTTFHPVFCSKINPMLIYRSLADRAILHLSSSLPALPQGTKLLKCLDAVNVFHLCMCVFPFRPAKMKKGWMAGVRDKWDSRNATAKV